ncbi:MAG: hypothetical protein ACREME_09260, partial [Gemmatimonadales bacterium]
YTSYLVQEPELVVASRDEMRRRVALQAAAPATGEAAVRRSEVARAAGQVSTLGDLANAQKTASDSLALSRSEANGDGSGRTIAGRVFRLRQGVWTDALHRAGLRVVDVEAFSPAYFALLRRLPELEPYWKELPSALVAGREASIRVASTGVRELSDRDLTRIAAAFRF